MSTIVNVDVLAGKWRTTVYRALGDLPDKNDNWFHFLVEAYSESHRFYHTLAHIKHVLNDVDFLLKEVGTETQSPLNENQTAALELAVWFHDVVFDTHSITNEIDSTDVAEKALSDLGVDSRIIDEVINLILLTHNHRPNSVLGRIMCDADLGIYATATHVYKEFIGNLRKEYVWMSPPGYKAYREAALKNLMNREDIFYTDPLQTYERIARYNINSELIGMKYV